ncbi:hypothetical protein LS73_008760 [Helicobacter muridarum]|uniref:Uncharacterized protein n=1 Tax=Helicobacter muridarum TaxID=216 RepID=A0A099TZE8_9HELI|nr:AAA family ATPase [Helicobacter muridarum]TLD98507.1 hypothetical protein LS73_008760 [Helicobacter muridarum]STQ86806.1 Uncharacterised protein [Helicobacter muridarum]
MKNIKICIVGISCCGKSTLLESLKKLLPHFNVIEGSKALCEIANISKDELKALDSVDKDKLRAQFLVDLKSRQENIIVSGHYSFIHDDGDFEIAMKDDVRFYDLVLFLDTDITFIQERIRQRDKKQSSIETLQKWFDFELEGIQKQCVKYSVPFSAISSNADEVAAFITFFANNKAKIEPKSVFDTFMSQYGERLKQSKTIVLTDCDGTLDNKDGVKEFYKIKEVSEFKLENAFHNHIFYGFYQFFRLSKKRLEIDEKTFVAAVKQASQTMQPHKNLIDLLENAPANVIAITAGIRSLWSSVFERYNASFFVVANDRTTIITQDTKAYFAKALVSLGYKVIAMGDGLVDVGMLECASVPVLIESKKTATILEQLSPNTRQRTIICNPNNCIESIRAVL